MNIIILDPGWKNLGVLLVSYSNEEKIIRKFSSTFDLEVFNKEISPIKIVKSLKKNIFNHIRNDSINNMVIEIQGSQWKKNRSLQEMIETVILTLHENCQLWRISAMSVKKYFGLEYGKGDHNKHKKDMLQFVTNSTNHIFCGEKPDNDHIADCIGLFNVYLSKHKRIRELHNEYKLETYVDFHHYLKEAQMQAVIPPQGLFSHDVLFLDQNTGYLRHCHNPHCPSIERDETGKIIYKPGGTVPWVPGFTKPKPGGKINQGPKCYYTWTCVENSCDFTCSAFKELPWSLEKGLKTSRKGAEDDEYCKRKGQNYHVRSNYLDFPFEQFQEELKDYDILNLRLAQKNFNRDCVPDFEDFTMRDSDGMVSYVQGVVPHNSSFANSLMVERVESKLDQVVQFLRDRYGEELDAFLNAIIDAPNEPEQVTGRKMERRSDETEREQPKFKKSKQ